MTRNTLAAIAVVIVFLWPSAAVGEPDDCAGETTGAQAVLTCQTSSQNGPGTTTASNTPSSTYEYLWLPACPNATPGSRESTLHCPGTTWCPDPAEALTTLWVRQIADPLGNRV